LCPDSPKSATLAVRCARSPERGDAALVNCKTEIAKTYPLDQAAEALADVEHGHPTGKVVLLVD